jgi:hypothetical protein
MVRLHREQPAHVFTLVWQEPPAQREKKTRTRSCYTIKTKPGRNLDAGHPRHQQNIHSCMPHRALFLLPSASLYQTNIASTSIFTTILQAAASRAWVRRASASPPSLYCKEDEKASVSTADNSLESSRGDVYKPPLPPLPTRSADSLHSCPSQHHFLCFYCVFLGTNAS